MCTTRCAPTSSCPPATRFRNEKICPHPSWPPETAQEKWIGCPRRFSLRFAPCLHPQTRPAAQSSANDIARRGARGACKMRKRGKESFRVCAAHQAVHSVLRSPANSLSSLAVVAAAKATGWCGRGRRHAHHERHRHFLCSKAVRILSGDIWAGSTWFLFSLINISTIGLVPSESTG